MLRLFNSFDINLSIFKNYRKNAYIFPLNFISINKLGFLEIRIKYISN